MIFVSKCSAAASLSEPDSAAKNVPAYFENLWAKQLTQDIDSGNYHVCAARGSCELQYALHALAGELVGIIRDATLGVE
jgi:hypothetical protein